VPLVETIAISWHHHSVQVKCVFFVRATFISVRGFVIPTCDRSGNVCSGRASVILRARVGKQGIQVR